MRTLIIGLLTTFLITACASNEKTYLSIEATALTQEERRIISDDILDIITGLYPVNTQIYIDGNTAFSETLSQAIRSKGYGISPQANDADIGLRYVLDSVNESLILCRIRVENHAEYSRLYRREKNDLLPIHTYSVRDLKVDDDA